MIELPNHVIMTVRTVARASDILGQTHTQTQTVTSGGKKEKLIPGTPEFEAHQERAAQERKFVHQYAMKVAAVVCSCA